MKMSVQIVSITVSKTSKTEKIFAKGFPKNPFYDIIKPLQMSRLPKGVHYDEY